MHITLTKEDYLLALRLPGAAQRRLLALVPAVLVLLVGALAYERARSVVNDVQEVGRSHAIIEGADGLLTRAIDAETGQRAYLLTGEETFLEPYVGARADIARSLDSLRDLVRDDPSQRARLNAIEVLVPERFALLETAIELRRSGATAAAASSSRLLAGKQKMDQLRALVSDLQGREKFVLAERGVAEQRSVRNASIVVAAAAIAALLISALVNLAFAGSLRERDAANTALKEVNEDLERQSEQLEMQAVEMESQAAELEATAEDLRSSNEELNRRERGAKLLSDASRVLASTLDFDKTLEAVAKLAVGDLADWCAVDLAEEDGRVRQVVVAHKEEAKVKWARELNKRYPPEYGGQRGVGHVIRTGQAEIYPDISDQMLTAAARDADHLAIMRELQIRSALVVPMIARGRTLGALTLISTAVDRRYGEADQAVAMELATRAAIAIDNAQLYRSALAASEAKSSFLATMSHELRTPLNAIIGYQSLLAEGIDGSLNAAQLAQLARIRAGADHLLGLIDEVLTFSRVEAGKEVVRRADAQLGSIVAEAITMVTPLADSRGLQLRNETTDARLVTDSGKVRQIILNLLSNAIKFSDRGEIVVRSRLNGESVAISIVDDGIGIAAENLDRIFDPFWQVEQRSTTRRVGGTGLGLSVSRSLARLLGGDVTVESKVEKGSTFTLTLPVKRGPPAST
ncbi:MAG TPA: CHASE3 domain-containing protein [Gemmatimonadaceae bacterium]|nr:CHASE3 domain-containing protein [Gemmatimonadaceae bacterium]